MKGNVYSLQFYFNRNREMVLLTETTQVNPYAQGSTDDAWTSLAEHLNRVFHSDDPTLQAEVSMRMVKEKVARMLKYFHKKENDKIRKCVCFLFSGHNKWKEQQLLTSEKTLGVACFCRSGTEEELTAKLSLLQEVSDLEDEAKRNMEKRQWEEAAACEQKCHEVRTKEQTDILDSRIVAMRAGKSPVSRSPVSFIFL